MPPKFGPQLGNSIISARRLHILRPTHNGSARKPWSARRRGRDCDPLNNSSDALNTQGNHHRALLGRRTKH